MLFVEGAKTRDQLAQIAAAIKTPMLVKMVPDSPDLSIDVTELGEMGYDVIIYPSFAFLAAGAAMDAGFVELHTRGA